MLAMAMMAIFGTALTVTGAFGTDDDPIDAGGDDDLPIDPQADADPADLGATFDVADGVVALERGADETGSLAMFRYTDTEDDENDIVEVYEARFYLVPEGVTLPQNTTEESGNIPGLDGFEGGPFAYGLEDMEEALGLQLLGTVDLEAGPEPLIEANAPVQIFDVEANTDGDELISFLPDGAVETWNGVEETEVDGSITGTEGTDWLTATGPDITVAGGDGADKLESTAAGVDLLGGGGEDVLLVSSGSTGNGGAGDDDLSARTLGTDTDVTLLGGGGNDGITLSGGWADGGSGDDTLASYGGGDATLFGGSGDDNLGVSTAGSSAHGGDGDDFVAASGGAAAFGGAGDDILQLGAGTSGSGDAGDDLIRVIDFHDTGDGPATVTLGEGEDTLHALIRNPTGGEMDAPFVVLTDFDPAEDTLQVGAFNTDVTVDSIEIVPGDDGTYADVRVTYSPLGNGQPPGVVTIRLEGAPDLSAGDVQITD